ncbi:pyruvate synthase [Sulfolobus acidocaldarius SUSAZ]|nr:pyruvate synthase [Sulfolobus acidocaldarius SUSAZ]
MLEIRFHGRGGQGVVTASHLLAEAAGYDNLYSSSFPIYGAERRGAEIEAYCRISDSQIRVTSPIQEPDYVVVLDGSLLHLSNNVYRGLKPSSVILANYASEIERDKKIITVNATKVASELGLIRSGWPMVNVIMLGSLIKLTRIPSIESLEKAIRDEFDDKLAEINIIGVRKMYELVEERRYNVVTT